MSFREVSLLRKVGKYTAAYRLAKQELEEDLNHTTAMSLFWAVRDLGLKYFLPQERYGKVFYCVQLMRLLLSEMRDEDGVAAYACDYLRRQILPHSEAVNSALELSKKDAQGAYRNITHLVGWKAEQLEEPLHDSFALILYRRLKADIHILTSWQTRMLLYDYLHLRNKRPSAVHSAVLSLAARYAVNHEDFNFTMFLKMWGINNLRREDLEDRLLGLHAVASVISHVEEALSIRHDSKVMSDIIREISLPGELRARLMACRVFRDYA